MRQALVVAFGLIACSTSHSNPTEAPLVCDHESSADSRCCRGDADCANGSNGFEACAPPGAALGCGVCNMDPSDCATDADCKSRGATLICNPVACACDVVAATRCTAGCTADSACAEGEACDLTANRCRAKSCASAADCPADFLCAPTGCQRATCTSDADCSGFCVEGACYSTAGECRGPVA